MLRKEPPERYVFNYRASYAQETAALIGYLVKVLRVAPEQIAVFTQKDSYGKGGYRGVVKSLQSHGFKKADQILRVSYERNSLDVDQAVRTIQENRERVRAIVMAASYRPAARFIKALRDLGIEAVFGGVSLVGGQAFAEELRHQGQGYAEGVIVTQVVPHPDTQIQGVLRYRKQLRKYFPEETPCFKSLEGYIVARIVTEALRRVGRPATRERMVDALESLTELDLGIGTPIGFGPNDHQGSDRVWGTVLDSDGRFQPLELE
jgi:ABC-type branched-subunit amino acid transport system substrate-binding protein